MAQQDPKDARYACSAPVTNIVHKKLELLAGPGRHSLHLLAASVLKWGWF